MLKGALSKLPLVCVVWNDAHGSAIGEYTVAEAKRDFHKPAPVHSFGLLVSDDAEGVTICMDDTSQPSEPAETYRGLSFIPRAMVVDVIPQPMPRRRASRSKAKQPQPAPPTTTSSDPQI